MPDLLHQEGLIMPPPPPPPKPKKRGVWQNTRAFGGGPANDDNLVDRVADFSYESDALAQLVVEMWLGQHKDLLAAPAATDYGQRSLNAKSAFAAKGVYLEQPIVLKETEYDVGFSLADAGLPSAVVFVLPDQARATIISTPPALVETAKMLMAVTPNGI
jgi:hypothetical protein